MHFDLRVLKMLKEGKCIRHDSYWERAGCLSKAISAAVYQSHGVMHTCTVQEYNPS